MNRVALRSFCAVACLMTVPTLGCATDAPAEKKQEPAPSSGGESNGFITFGDDQPPLQKKKTREEKFAEAEAGCSSGDGAKCFALGELHNGDRAAVPSVKKRSAAQIAAYVRGCDLKHVPSCLGIGGQDPTLMPREEQDSYLDKGCALGDVTSCDFVAQRRVVTRINAGAERPFDGPELAQLRDACRNERNQGGSHACELLSYYFKLLHDEVREDVRADICQSKGDGAKTARERVCS